MSTIPGKCVSGRRKGKDDDQKNGVPQLQFSFDESVFESNSVTNDMQRGI